MILPKAESPGEDLPEPRTRAFNGADGVPVVLAGGEQWLLRDGGLMNVLDDLRDKIDDEARLTGQVDMVEIGEVACHLLEVNYSLTREEIMALVLGAEHKALAKAVMEALFGPDHPRRTYTVWAASALVANGIDPDTVSPSLRPHVLAQLVGTGRALPLSNYIESAEAAPQLAAIRTLAGIRPKAAT